MSVLFLKTNWKYFVFIAFVLLVIFGIYNNPDRKNAQTDAELQEIFSAMNATLDEVVLSSRENQICFEDESLKGKSAECVTNLRSIQHLVGTADKANVTKLEEFYKKNQSTLDKQTKKMIEDSLRLYKSNAYSDLMNAYDEFFAAYIEWHKYFRDYVSVKGIDSMSPEEIMQSKYLAENILRAEDNLKLKKTALSNYLYENFDSEFIDEVNAYAEGIK